VFNLGKLWGFTENPRNPEFPICAIDAVEFFEDAGFFFNVTLEMTQLQPNQSYRISATISGGKPYLDMILNFVPAFVGR